MALDEVWPQFGLRITTPRLVMRPPTDDDFPALIEVVRGGIHDPATMPFAVPWTDVAPPDLERGVVRYWWSCRASWTVSHWMLGLAVFLDGEPVGFQDVQARDFLILRTAETGSWLGRAHQGRGIGTEMRRAAVAFAFGHLGAERITSGAFVDNTASIRVSEAAGYEPNGRAVVRRRNGVGEQQRFVLTRQRWEQLPSPLPIEVAGFEACRPMFGLEAPG